VPVPQGDPFFDPQATGTQVIGLDRSHYHGVNGTREQINEITAYLDASMVYGSDLARAMELRALDGTGRLKMSAGELLEAYVEQRVRDEEPRLIMGAAPVYRVEDALERLTRLLGGPDWQNLLAFLPTAIGDERLRRSALAAHMAACLELARDGVIDLNQTSPFGPIYLRRRR
jgi:hypothetical protein